jgi:hypothetical protein
MIFTVIKKAMKSCWSPRILETSVDREDKIYRWGGEEFLLFCPIRRSAAR